MEVIWYRDGTRNFLEDLQALAKSLDFYSVTIHVDQSDGQCIMITEGGYTLSKESKGDAFTCPNCGGKTFNVLEGEYVSKPVLGLACVTCSSYGAVFPAGM